MKRFGALVAVLLLTWLAVPTTSSAQSRPQTREGFFIGFGFGYGSFGCSTCDGEREAGGSGYLKLGGAMNEQVLLGVESNAWVKEVEGATLTSTILAAVIQYYPNAESGFFLKGGAGFTRLEASAFGFSAAEDGFGIIGGLGYDARLGANFSLSPYANYVYGSINDETTNLFQLGLGIMWH